jgi:hypothetical protein
MRHLFRLRLIGALLAAFMILPAFAGFAGAAACPGNDSMPCCTHSASTDTLSPGCCRIEPARAPVQAPLPASISDWSTIGLVNAAAIMGVPLIDDASTGSCPSRGPTSPGTPVYLALSALRR